MKKQYIVPAISENQIYADLQILEGSPHREVDYGNRPTPFGYDPDEEQDFIDAVEDDDDNFWSTI